MKHLKVTMIILAVCAMSLTFTNCSNGAKTDNQTQESAAEQGPEYTSAYICPMHCEGSGSDEAGECPVCGMAYVENTNSNEHEGHNH